MRVQAEPNAGTGKFPHMPPLRRSQRPGQPPHNDVCAAHCTVITGLVLKAMCEKSHNM